VTCDSLGVGISEFLLAKLDVLFDSVAEAALTTCDVAGQSVLTAFEAEAFQAVVFHLAADYFDNVSVD